MVGSHPQNSLTPAQTEAQRQAHLQASERAKLRSQKPTDKNLPEGVEDCIIGDGVQRYRELRELERRLDATMMRKRLDIQESVNRNVKVGQIKRGYRCRSDFATAFEDTTYLGKQYCGGSTMAGRLSRCEYLRFQQ